MESEQKLEVNNLLGIIQSSDFIFTLYLMKVIPRITNNLSKVLQRKDQVVINVGSCLQFLRRVFKHARFTNILAELKRT